jgi:hypothetical protein
MADHLRHAAGQARYEVHEVLDGSHRVSLGLRFESADFEAALDFAFEYLETRDPGRRGAVEALEIARVRGLERETVWAYSRSASGGLARDPVGVWGFDVTRPWRSPYRMPSRSGAAR